MFGFIKKIFIGLLTGLVSISSHAKCVSLSNQKWMIQPTLINLHPNKYSQEFHYYLFTVKLDRCVGSCNTLNDLSNKVCVPNKTEDLNLSASNMATGINESKTLTKHISCKCKYKFHGRKCNSYQWWSSNKCQCEYKKRHLCEKDYWNPDTCSCENGKYLASIMNDSVIICDEIIDADADADANGEAKSNHKAKLNDEINFNEKKATYKMQSFYVLLTFLLITIVLLIAVSIYCYLIKYRTKQKPFQFTNNKFKKNYILKL